MGYGLTLDALHFIFMKKKIISAISILFVMIFILFFNIENFLYNYNSQPTPTEFILKKKNRQEFKKSRQDWIENMHKSHPNDDWREIDAQNRKLNTDRALELRKIIFNEISEILDCL